MCLGLRCERRLRDAELDILRNDQGLRQAAPDLRAAYRRTRAQVLGRSSAERHSLRCMIAFAPGGRVVLWTMIVNFLQ